MRAPLLFGLAVAVAAACNDSPSANDAAVSLDLSATTRADGTLGPWMTLQPMPTARANHCATTAGGFLVVVGGNHQQSGGFVTSAAVEAAPLQADGTVGAWLTAGATPSPVFECTLGSDGATLYLVDGIFDRVSDQAKVWTADLSPSGALGSWRSLGPLPAGARVLYSNAWIRNKTLYAMDSKLPADGNVTAILAAPLSTGIGPWNEYDVIPGFRGHPQYAFNGSFFYSLGGYVAADVDLVVAADVNAARLFSDGTVGGELATTPLPAPRAFGTVTAVDDYLFLVGGKDAIFTASGSTLTASAHTGGDGALAAWSTETPLPAGRTNHATALGGDFLYVTGGGLAGPGLATVFAARVRR